MAKMAYRKNDEQNLHIKNSYNVQEQPINI
jgi:hypothetical protein